MKYDKCVNCQQPFTPFVCFGAASTGNVKTPDGWLETQISGLCEICFDEITDEAEIEEGYDGPNDENEPAF